MEIKIVGIPTIAYYICLMKNQNNKNRPSIGRIFGMIHHNAQTYFKHEFKDFPIGHAQIFTLHHLIKENGISQKQLTRYSKLDKGSIASQLHYLEKNGYIIRKPSEEDARVLNIYITKKTEIIEDKLQNIFYKWSSTILDGFSEDEKNNIFEILNKIISNVENKIKDIKK